MGSQVWIVVVVLPCCYFCMQVWGPKAGPHQLLILIHDQGMEIS